MPKPTEVVDPTTVLTTLNQKVEEQERFLGALRSAQEIVAKAMLGGTGTANGHHPRRRRASAGGASRAQMLTTILQNAPHPVTVDEIMAEMSKHGRTGEDRRYAYNTLSYLQRKGVAKTSERGKWVSVTQSTQQAA